MKTILVLFAVAATMVTSCSNPLDQIKQVIDNHTATIVLSGTAISAKVTITDDAGTVTIYRNLPSTLTYPVVSPTYINVAPVGSGTVIVDSTYRGQTTTNTAGIPGAIVSIRL